jgi:parvulin-like peptidyl-prolyl isomerase
LGKSVALPELDPTIFKAILSLEIGEISEPITSSRGSHILVLDQFTPGLLKTRDDVKGSLVSIFADELMLAEERRLMAALKRKVVVY